MQPTKAEVEPTAPDGTIGCMSRHSVRRHLRVEVDAYDEAIRRFIPGYQAMLEVAAAEIARVEPRRVTDLGGGTGALSEAILLAAPHAVVELIDVDGDMLARARERLARFGSPGTLSRGVFRRSSSGRQTPSPLRWHSITSPRWTRSGGSSVGFTTASGRGGVFVNADATMPADPGPREATWRAWTAHLVSCGISEERAYRHFAEWQEEDTYFPPAEEAAAMRAAGFEMASVWSDGPMVVAVGRRPTK